jgi:DNA polymerase-4
MYDRPMSRGPLLHADADAFFASVVMRGRPDLAARPLAVVNLIIVASPNYLARALGVRSGMLATEAVRRCPDLVLVDVPHAEVEEVGDALFDLFHEVADAVEPGSIEEAFLDTSHLSWNDAVDRARALRRRAAAELGIPVTVGVGRTKLMAKLASRAGKPDGLYVIGVDEEDSVRTDLLLTDIWGVGPTTTRRLAALGIRRLTDLDDVPRPQLRQLCGTTMAGRLWRLRDGTDDAEVRPLRRRASFSSEGSIAGYGRPDWTPDQLLETCVARVCHRVERAGLAGAHLALILRGEDGQPAPVRRSAVEEATTRPDVWLPVARDLLRREPVPPLSRVGVTLAGLVPADQVQGALF